MGAAVAKKHKRNGLLTSADYMALPDDGNRYELIHGELIESPSILFEHGSTVAFVGGLVQQFARDNKLGRVSSRVDIVVDDTIVLCPDVVYVSANRMGIVQDHIYGAPDLAVEITSPSNWQMDVFAKMHEYERFGIREYWVLDIVDQRYKAYQWCLRGKRYHGGLVQGREIKSLVLKGFKLNLEDVWASATW